MVRSLTCSTTAPGSACNHCISDNNELNCKPVQVYIKAVLPLDQRCYRCQLKTDKHRKLNSLTRLKCNGQYPCNVCVENKAVCIHLSNKDNPPCTNCIKNKSVCSRDINAPCSHCTSQERVCTRFTDNDTTWTATYQPGALDDVVLNSCQACERASRRCTGDVPSKKCLSITHIPAYSTTQTCRMKVNDNTIVAKEKAAYTLHTSDDGQESIIYDTTYQGHRLVSKRASYTTLRTKATA
jgi:hypothetical protein